MFTFMVEQNDTELVTVRHFDKWLADFDQRVQVWACWIRPPVTFFNDRSVKTNIITNTFFNRTFYAS
jgi:hypothetical protein